MLVGAAIGLRFALPDKTPDNLDPLNRWQVPNVALDLRGRSGPVAVLIEYIIREEDTHVFLDAMNDRRRIRRRDGALQWELLRDTEKPEQWMKSYHVPTWVDYVRHNQRRTYADAGDRRPGSRPAQRRRATESASNGRPPDGLDRARVADQDAG